MIAPAAPSAAAGVGLVIPPRIDPRTATISIKGGNTTRIRSFCANLAAAWRTPQMATAAGAANISTVFNAEVSA